MARVSAAPDKFDLAAKFSLFSEQWRPKVVAALNGQEVKVVKVQGTFPWHHHDTEDEFFLVQFNDSANLIQSFTPNLEEIQNKLAFTQSKGRTALLDAVYMALQEMKNGLD